MEPGSLVFLGAGEFAVPSLQALVAAGEHIALVITQPARPRGRGRKTEPTPVHRAAEALGLRVEAPENVNDPAVVAELRALDPEFLVLVDYGQMLSAEVLGASKCGPVNVHPSLLPRHRGPSPVVWAVLSGDETTGVSTMLMDAGMDTGPLLMRREVKIEAGETAGELSLRLSRLGGELLVETLRGMRSGGVTSVAQDSAGASYSHLIDRELQLLRWEGDAASVIHRIQALSPKPGARVILKGVLIKLLRAKPALGKATGAPGEVLSVREDGFDVACGTGALTVLELLPEGRNAMRAADFARGGKVTAGMKFEEVN